MLLSDMTTEIGVRINRSDYDARIKRAISQAIDYIYNLIPARKLNRIASLTATIDSETIDLPLDFGDMVGLDYTPGDGSGYSIDELSRIIYRNNFADNVTTSNRPEFYSIENAKLYIYPIPSTAYSLTLSYIVSKPNIYTHDVSLTHDASAATNGVAVYVDEDAEATGIGKLYFVSPTNTDGKLITQMADGHTHTVTIYDDDAAATLGSSLYFNEVGNNSDASGYQRALFVSPTGMDCVVKTDSYRGHYHYVHITDDPAASSNGVAVYLDEDNAVKSDRLLYVSPTTTDGSLELAITETGIIPPFLEEYDEAIQAKACIEAFVLDRNWDAVNTYKETLRSLVSGIVANSSRKGSVVIQPRAYGSRNIVTDPTRYITIL